MSKLQAAESLRRFAEHYKHFIDAAEQLEAVGVLEQSIKEASAEAEKSKAILADIKAEIVKAKATHKKAIDLNDGAMNKAIADADAILKDKQEEAVKVVANARNKAEAIVAKATEAAEKINLELTANQAALNLSVKEAETSLRNAETAKVLAQAEFEAFKEKAEALKAKLKDFMS